MAIVTYLWHAHAKPWQMQAYVQTRHNCCPQVADFGISRAKEPFRTYNQHHLQCRHPAVSLCLYGSDHPACPSAVSTQKAVLELHMFLKGRLCAMLPDLRFHCINIVTFGLTACTAGTWRLSSATTRTTSMRRYSPNNTLPTDRQWTDTAGISPNQCSLDALCNKSHRWPPRASGWRPAPLHRRPPPPPDADTPSEYKKARYEMLQSFSLEKRLLFCNGVAGRLRLLDAPCFLLKVLVNHVPTA